MGPVSVHIKRKRHRSSHQAKNVRYLSSTEVVNRTCRGQSAEYFNRRHSQPFSFTPPVDLWWTVSTATTWIHHKQCKICVKLRSLTQQTWSWQTLVVLLENWLNIQAVLGIFCYWPASRDVFSSSVKCCSNDSLSSRMLWAACWNATFTSEINNPPS